MNLKKTVATMCTVSAIVCTTSLQTAIAAEVRANNDKPNFVTIVIDDMGFSDLGPFGGEVEIPTPNIDKLAGEKGTILSQFYAAPTSTPSRSMLFTGKSNHKAGIGTMPGWDGKRPAQQCKPKERPEDECEQPPGYPGEVEALSPDVLPFPQVLQENGYHTMMTGKWDLGEKPGLYAHDRGFDETLVLLPGGDVQFISDENGDVITSHIPKKYENLGRTSLYNKNGKEFTDFPPNAYSTDFYTDEAIKMLADWEKDKSKPFYLNVSHIATHTPWQAPADVTAKYMDVYAKGWDKIREERFERQKKLGFFPADAKLPERHYDVPAWEDLSDEDKEREIKKMAVYAAMIDILDQNVGKLVDYLKEIGEYDNTVIVVFSDNGAAFKFSAFNRKVREDYIRANFDLSTENLGNATSYGGASRGWAMASNTPYNRNKKDLFEGGIHTAAFVHYPQSKAAAGVKNDCIRSVMDIAPTFLDMADITYPDTFNGKPNEPMQGVSMANIFDGDTSCDSERWLGWEMDGGKAVRHKNWKLSQKWDEDKARWDGMWYLFDLDENPFEVIEQEASKKNPEEFKAMLALYEEYAEENQVVEVYHKILPTDLKSVFLDDGESTALLTGGISIGDKTTRKPFKEEVTATYFRDMVEVQGLIRPETEHQGLPGEILVVASYLPPSSEAYPTYFSVTQNGLSYWDGVEEVPPFKKGISELPSMLPVLIYEGLPVLAGDFYFWFGYRLEDGTVVHSEDPMKLHVTYNTD